MTQPSPTRAPSAADHPAPEPPHIFRSYPNIDELVIPVPGIEYALVLTKNMHRAESLDLPYGMIPQLRSFLVAAEDHDPVPMVLLARGRRISGARNTSWAPKVWLDPEAPEATGIHPPEWLEEDTAPTPDSTPTKPPKGASSGSKQAT